MFILVAGSLGRGVLQKNWLGVLGPLPKPLPYLFGKIYDLPSLPHFPDRTKIPVAVLDVPNN